MQRLFVVLLAFALGACATGYGRMGLGGGYAETQLSPTSYQIRTSTNAYSQDFAATMAFYRAAELTRENGFSHFAVFDGERTTVVETGLYGMGYRGQNVELTMHMQNDATPLEIVPGKSVRVFSAAEVMAQLQAEIDARR